MVRSGDDVLVIDRCVRRRHRMPPPIGGFSDDHAPVMVVQLYLNGKLTPGTRIHQLADGRKYIVSENLPFRPHPAPDYDQFGPDAAAVASHRLS